MQRPPLSHKGENGKVAVIGGSRFQHGAPLFAALATEASGVDLLFVCLPSCHATVARMQSLNLQVHPFAGDDLCMEDVEPILELLATMDCAVIGPGLARNAETLKALESLVARAPCPLVLDATALQPWTLRAVQGKTAVLTPHAGELERMELSMDALAETASAHRVTILAKGPVDVIVAPDGTQTRSEGGNAGLTVGGTGDALAGLCAGLLAQQIDPANAAVIASRVIKRAGEELAEQYGTAYGTRRIITTIPTLLDWATEEE